VFAHQPLEDPDGEGPPTWESIARTIRTHGPDPEVSVKDLWSETEEPDNEADWEKAARTLLHHFWKDDSWACLSYFTLKVTLLDQAAEQAERDTAASVARRQLTSDVERLQRPRTAAWTEFTRALTDLRNLQDRVFIEAGEAAICETNPSDTDT
jgi:hypothetical protein